MAAREKGCAEGTDGSVRAQPRAQSRQENPGKNKERRDKRGRYTKIKRVGPSRHEKKMLAIARLAGQAL